eukprot:2907985-Amphidinium_carterae.1
MERERRGGSVLLPTSSLVGLGRSWKSRDQIAWRRGSSAGECSAQRPSCARWLRHPPLTGMLLSSRKGPPNTRAPGTWHAGQRPEAEQSGGPRNVASRRHSTRQPQAYQRSCPRCRGSP